MKRILPQPVLSLVLLVTWLLINNSIAPGTIIMGAIVGLVVPLLTCRFWEIEARVSNPLALVGYAGVVLVDIIRANFVVARQVLGPSRTLHSQIFKLPLDLRGRLPVSVLAATITLTPGTVSCRVSPDQTCIWVHALHAGDLQAEIDEIKQRYERRLMRVFGQADPGASTTAPSTGNDA